MSLPRSLVFSGALGLAACAGAPADSPDDFGYEGTGIEFTVAPLTLDSLADACYSFAIYNEQGQLVVGRGPGAAAGPGGASLSGTALHTVCASQFGNGDGGDVSYVAPCDAQAPPAGVGNGDAVNDHTVRLWVDALCTSAVASKTGIPDWSTTGTPNICTQMQAYVNPCGSTGCELEVACIENADTPVTFNLTVMGAADQGFFDVAVNFDDVFCSAKLDNCNVLGDPIRLVFDEAGNRMDTVVLAVSCTAGPGTADTHLTHTQLEVGCDDGAGTSIGGAIPTVLAAEGNFTHNGLRGAAYFGTESLPGANKVYSNFAFGIPTGFTCDIAWQVIPSNGPFVQPGGANTYSSFGYVNFNAKDVPPGSVACQENGLNDAGSAVTTVYASTNDTDTLTPVSQIGLGDDEIAPAGGGDSDAPLGFVTIPAGSFVMGSPSNEVGRSTNEAQVSVTLTRSFYLAEAEVTQGEWTALSGGVNPSCFQTAGTGSCTTANSNATAPVEQVSWWSIFGYANALSEAEGLAPCFTLPATKPDGTACTGTWQAGTLDCGDQMPTVTGGDVYACEGYRLPTEAEWEYAARAGTTTATYGGNLSATTGCVTLSGAGSFANGTPLADLGWFSCNNGSSGTPTYGTKAVKGKAPNAWGLYDMLGNVWEWTWDRYDASLPGETDPQRTASGAGRVYRGGYWYSSARGLRAANRINGGAPGYRAYRIGFRLTRSVP